MLLNPVKVVTKTITICGTSDPDRFCVVVYVDGKLDSAHPPMSLEEAKARADEMTHT